MLGFLHIEDIVLIDRLELALGRGLNVLTGETGAGKSILLDSLGLALGSRGDAGLIRAGAERGRVSAGFVIPPGHPVNQLLAQQEIDIADQLVLRRTLGRDGRSRAFVNDQPVGIGLLREIGGLLVEIHGQHDDRGLLDPAGHRALLDLFGGHGEVLRVLGARYQAWLAARATHQAAIAAQQVLATEQEYIRHAVAELSAVAPEVGEEAVLADRRALMQRGQAVHGGLGEVVTALHGDGGVDAALRGALRKLQRLADKAGPELDGALDALDRAAVETGEALATLEETLARLDFDPRALEQVEERLFELRGLARKYGVLADDLPRVLADFAAKCHAFEQGGAGIAALALAERDARAGFEAAVAGLSRQRAAAATQLDQRVAAELSPLKLDKARFRTVLAPLDPEAWGEQGGERLGFEVSTNPGAPFGPLAKIASGGELARFILALKVALAAVGDATTMIFDEVDRGVGGATASAVGERLAKLSGEAQLLVVTHSPQVAALGHHHLKIEKDEEGGHSVTRVRVLEPDERREELARMLAGASITDQARAAARALLGDRA